MWLTERELMKPTVLQPEPLSSIVIIMLIFALVCAQLGLTQVAASEAEQSLQALRAADLAASTQSREHQQWAEEQQRWQAQLAVLADQIAAERALAQDLQQQLAALAQQQKAVEAAAHDLINDELATLAKELSSPYQAWSGHHFPGMPNSEEMVKGALAEDGYQAIISLQRVYQASLQAAREWSTSIETGELAGEQLAVHVLRCGAVAAWWVDMTGTRAGTVKPQVDRLVLAETDDESQRRAITDAWRVVNGQRNPSVLLLPLAAVEVQR